MVIKKWTNVGRVKTLCELGYTIPQIQIIMEKSYPCIKGALNKAHLFNCAELGDREKSIKRALDTFLKLKPPINIMFSELDRQYIKILFRLNVPRETIQNIYKDVPSKDITIIRIDPNIRLDKFNSLAVGIERNDYLAFLDGLFAKTGKRHKY